MPKNRLQGNNLYHHDGACHGLCHDISNIALETGGMKNFVFKAALGEFYHDCCLFYPRYIHCRTTWL